jgi:hypothetical protein
MSKYRAEPTTVDGIRFASKKEARHYSELMIRQRLGEIRNLQVHPALPLLIDGKPVLIRSTGYPNGRSCKYTADFAYFEGETRVYEEVKGGLGTDTEASRLRRAVAEAIYGIRVRVV